MEKENIYLGSEFKVNISLTEKAEGLTMDDYDFRAEFYCTRNDSLIKGGESPSVVVEKDLCLKVDSDNYVACLDSTVVGVGKLKCKVTAYIPDTDFSDGLRTEIDIADTGIEIINS